MNKRHPRRRIRTDKGNLYIKHPVVASNTGRHLVCGASTLSDFSKYGLGIDLYFKFMVGGYPAACGCFGCVRVCVWC